MSTDKSPAQEFINTTPKGEKKDFSIPMEGSYHPSQVESSWDAFWEAHDLYQPDDSKDEKFVIVLPPPNVTGSLHLGHALTISVQDCLVRWNRMNNKSVLWVPGTDHAGIATQVVVEKQLARTRGLSRHDLGREEFIKAVWEWKEANGDNIARQTRSLGASLDWSRARFTMDDMCATAVKTAFLRMHQNKQIYRANRIVSWSCSLRSAISTIEVDYLDVEGSTMVSVPGHPKPVEIGVIHSFAYPVEGSDEQIVVSTTRIETMLGDVAVAVHPEDPRYKHLIGKKLVHPFIAGREVVVIADPILVDMAFGTGAVKITPAHDPNDFACGQRHNLPRVNLLDDSGIMNANCGVYAGLHRFEVRERIIEDLKALNLYKGKENNKMAVGLCSRSKDIIEPIIRPQWWVDCKDIAAKSVNAVREKELTILPASHEQVWYRWLENIQDWCISRQLWWGHRIPAYYARNTSVAEVEENPDRWFITDNAETALVLAKAKFPEEAEFLVMEQDEDVLDTWFSSGLFPFSVMGWPNNTEDFGKYFPGTLLETGNDILFFWVARMVMMSLALTGKLPFSTVFLHTMVRDRIGRKMSKSLGNVIDPLDVINGISLEELQSKLLSGNLDAKEVATAQDTQKKDFPTGIPECGSDALRFGLLGYTRQGSDINLDHNRIVVARNFCNKLWQATRFALMNFSDDFNAPENFDQLDEQIAAAGGATTSQKWILSRLHHVTEVCDHAFKNYEFGDATVAIQAFFVDELCSRYLELIKPIVKLDENSTPEAKLLAQSHLAVLFVCLETVLKLLHPFMPFVTEELYHRLPGFQARQDKALAAIEAPTKRDLSGSIMVKAYPVPADTVRFSDAQAESDIGVMDAVVGAIRSAKANVNLTKSQRPSVYAVCETEALKSLMTRECKNIAVLSFTSELTGLTRDEAASAIPEGCLSVVVNGDITIYMVIAGLVDVASEVIKTERKLKETIQLKENLDKTFAAPNYINAKEEIKAKNAARHAELVSEIESYLSAIKNFSGIVSRSSYIPLKIADLQSNLDKVVKNETKTRSTIKAPKEGEEVVINKKTQDTLDSLAAQRGEIENEISSLQAEFASLSL